MQSHVNPSVGGSSAGGVPMPKRNLRAILAPISVVVVLGAITAGTLFETFLPVVAVEVEPVIAESVSVQSSTAAQPTTASRVVQAPGWLEADPYLVACSALADGVVDEIFVLEGEAVEAGQLVATLVDDDARLALDEASARHMLAIAGQHAAQAELKAAQVDWDNPVEDERMIGVYRSRVSAKVQELEQLSSLVAMESARLAGLQEELDRSIEALQSGAATSTTIVIQQNAVDAQAAMLSATQQRRGILESQLAEFRSEFTAATRNSELRVNDSRRLEIAKAGLLQAEAIVNAAQTEIGIAQLRLDRMSIEAPIAGNVQRRLKQPGDKVMLQMDSGHSSHILHLYDPGMLQVRVDVPLADASEIFVGQLCEVVVDVLPDTAFSGEVTRITHEADLQKNTLQVKVNVKNPLPILKPEMLTRVKFIPAGGSPQAGAAQAGDTEQSVYLVSPDLVSSSGLDGMQVSAVRHRKGQGGRIEIIQVDQLGLESGLARISGDLRTSDLLAFNAENLEQNQRVSIVPRASDGGQP
jgi:HlyD family secretion protein